MIGDTLVSIGSSAGAAYCIVHRLSWAATMVNCCFASCPGSASRLHRTVSTFEREFGPAIAERYARSDVA